MDQLKLVDEVGGGIRKGARGKAEGGEGGGRKLGLGLNAPGKQTRDLEWAIFPVPAGRDVSAAILALYAVYIAFGKVSRRIDTND
jgi:hypothetical protein